MRRARWAAATTAASGRSAAPVPTLRRSSWSRLRPVARSRRRRLAVVASTPSPSCASPATSAARAVRADRRGSRVGEPQRAARSRSRSCARTAAGSSARSRPCSTRSTRRRAHRRAHACTRCSASAYQLPPDGTHHARPAVHGSDEPRAAAHGATRSTERRARRSSARSTTGDRPRTTSAARSTPPTASEVGYVDFRRRVERRLRVRRRRCPRPGSYRLVFDARAEDASSRCGTRSTRRRRCPTRRRPAGCTIPPMTPRAVSARA